MNLSDVITKPVKSFEKCGGVGVRLAEQRT